MSQDILYSHSSLLITLLLFGFILLFNEVGFRIGRFIQSSTDTETKALTGAVQSSMLGILALLLGFTFSMSMQRYDNRNQALIAEANAIGTVVLRTELLPESQQPEIRAKLAEYVAQRVEIGQIDLSRADERQPYAEQTALLQRELWRLAAEAANLDSRAITSGAFLGALTSMFDARDKRNALLQLHVPEVVLLLLFTVFVASGSMLGYSAGLSGNRILVPTALVSFLIALVVFIIIDLDRPKRGLIKVDQGMIQEIRVPGSG